MSGKKVVVCVTIGMIGALLGCGGMNTAPAPTATPGVGFRQTNLVADLGGAAHTDPALINPWGIAFQPGQPFFIADNNRGSAKIFDPAGNSAIPLTIGIPLSVGSTLRSHPTGDVFNPNAQDFLVRGTPAQFLFATADGTISTWASINGSNPSIAILARDDSASGASYTGLSILTPACCREYLALADFRRGFIATNDTGFNLLDTPGPFKDRDLPAGFVPFNIQLIGGQVFVTYALQDASGTNPVAGAGNGFVDIFDQEGNFMRRFASNGPLNAPWGITQAPANFGPFSNAILVGNFGDGVINAFDPASGNFLGALENASGNVIVNPGLWALVFRNDNLANPNTLFFTAGSASELHGLLGTIAPN